jgi:hypothetical protein
MLLAITHWYGDPSGFRLLLRVQMSLGVTVFWRDFVLSSDGRWSICYRLSYWGLRNPIYRRSHGVNDGRETKKNLIVIDFLSLSTRNQIWFKDNWRVSKPRTWCCASRDVTAGR